MCPLERLWFLFVSGEFFVNMPLILPRELWSSLYCSVRDFTAAQNSMWAATTHLAARVAVLP